MKKKGLLIGLLLMAVGFAAVSTTLVINNAVINTPRNGYGTKINPRGVVTGFALDNDRILLSE